MRGPGGHLLPGHPGLKPKQLGNRELADQWFREVKSDGGVSRARAVLEEIFARAMSDPKTGKPGDASLLRWLGDRIVSPLKPREVDEDEQRDGGALVLVRDAKTRNYRVQGPDIQAVVGEPPWRETGERKGDDANE